MFRRLVVSQAAGVLVEAFNKDLISNSVRVGIFFFSTQIILISAPNEIYYSITVNLLSDTLSNVIDLDGFYFNEYSLVHASCLRVHLDSL